MTIDINNLSQSYRFKIKPTSRPTTLMGEDYTLAAPLLWPSLLKPGGSCRPELLKLKATGYCLSVMYVSLRIHTCGQDDYIRMNFLRSTTHCLSSSQNTENRGYKQNASTRILLVHMPATEYTDDTYSLHVESK